MLADVKFEPNRSRWRPLTPDELSNPETVKEHEQFIQDTIHPPVEGFPGFFYKRMFGHTIGKGSCYNDYCLPKLWCDPDMRGIIPGSQKGSLEGDWLNSYGVCDSPQQFMEKYGEYLQKSERKFVVMFGEIVKAEQPAQGGWRWHKWGPYIGTHEIQYEYLYDEKDIERVFIYEICEIADEDPGNLMDNMRAEFDARRQEKTTEPASTDAQI